MKTHRRRSVAALLLATAAAGLAHADVVVAVPDAPTWAVAQAPLEVTAPPIPQQPERFALAAGDGLPTAQGFVSALPDIGLWKFIASIRNIQQSTPLHVLESQVRILEISSAVPAAVPLPGAAWFMVMGLMGLAGVKLTGRRAGGSSLPAGAVPA